MIDIRPNTKAAYQLFHDGALALSQVEQTGIRIDVDYCKRAIAHMTKQMTEVENKIKTSKMWKLWRRKYGENAKLTATEQLAHVLFKLMGVEPTKTTASGRASVDEESLSSLKIKEVNLILHLRKMQKACGTYLQALVRETVDGFLHPTFDLHTAKTFRSSSSHPNFQNIPIRDPGVSKLVRRAFIPRKGRHLVEIDYGKLEVCINACYNQDPVLIEYIRDKTQDMHRDMAAQCYKAPTMQVSKDMRYCGKNNFVFPEFYGDYFVNCAGHLWGSVSQMKLQLVNGTPLRKHLKKQGLSTYKKFEHHIQQVEKDFWGRRFKVYAEWKEDWYDQYCEQGYFDTLTGFHCGGLMKRNEVINYPAQGSAFHCLLWSLIELMKELKRYKMKSLVIGQIHDNIVSDVVPDELDDFLALVYEICCKRLPKAWDWITVPLEVDAEVTPVDGSWHEKKEVKFAA